MSSYIVKYRHALLLLCLLSIDIGLIYAEIKKSGFHPQGLSCQDCHLVRHNLSKENAYQLIASQEYLCGSCHENALKVSHPSGFNPGRPLPAEYPIDWKGDMTCSTCHNIHKYSGTSLIGNKTAKTFCLSCHEAVFFDAMVDSGASIQQGHVAANESNLASIVDPFSLQCMNCHSDRGDAIEVRITTTGLVRHSSGSINHPIGMPYNNPNRYGLYRDVSQLSDAILLPDGKVSCVSCHNGYSKKHGEVITEINKRSLCFECHDM